MAKTTTTTTTQPIVHIPAQPDQPAPTPQPVGQPPQESTITVPAQTVTTVRKTED